MSFAEDLLSSIEQNSQVAGELWEPARWPDLIKQADAVYTVVSKIIPTLTFELYEVAVGHKTQPRVHVKGSGIRKFNASPNYNNGSWDWRRAVLSHALYSKSKGFGPDYNKSGPDHVGENAARSFAYNFTLGKLLTNFGADVQRKIGALVPDTESSALARSRVESNKKRSHDQRKLFALDRLAEAMRSYDFSEEDVLEAWQMAQVTKVMES